MRHMGTELRSNENYDRTYRRKRRGGGIRVERSQTRGEGQVGSSVAHQGMEPALPFYYHQPIPLGLQYTPPPRSRADSRHQRPAPTWSPFVMPRPDASGSNSRPGNSLMQRP